MRALGIAVTVVSDATPIARFLRQLVRLSVCIGISEQIYKWPVFVVL